MVSAFDDEGECWYSSTGNDLSVSCDEALRELYTPTNDVAADRAPEASAWENKDDQLVVSHNSKQAAGGVEHQLVDREREVRRLECLMSAMLITP